MTNILFNIIIVIMAVLGVLLSLSFVISLPAIIIWKIYRKIRYGYKLTD